MWTQSYWKFKQLYTEAETDPQQKIISYIVLKYSPVLGHQEIGCKYRSRRTDQNMSYVGHENTASICRSMLGDWIVIGP